MYIVSWFLQPIRHHDMNPFSFTYILPPPPPQDLLHLCSLHTLSLCEPLYPPNPICRLCNYSTHTLYHLPQLQCLDGKDVSSPELHKLIQARGVRREGRGEGVRREGRGEGHMRARGGVHKKKGGRGEKRRGIRDGK